MIDWPDSYDFRDDEVCQTVFKPFIDAQMADLKAYDDQRPAERTYVFPEHAQRVADDVRKTCLHIGLGERVAENMYWAVLPHDIGKKNLPLELWDSDEKPDPRMKKLRRTHTLLGVQIANEFLPAQHHGHPFYALMIDIMAYHHEQLDGQGTLGIMGDKLSQPVRLASIVEAYDGYSIWRPHFGERDITPTGVLARMREEKGADMYDMELFDAFAEMKLNETTNAQNATV